MSILDSYKAIAESLNFSITDEDFFLTKMPTGTEQPTTIDGKRLVMPTKAILKKGLGDSMIAFHPLSESMAREATSEVQKRLQKQAKGVIGHQLITITQGLMDLVANSENHKKVPVKQSAFLKELAGLDKSCMNTINKIIAAAVKRNKLVTVYLKSSGIINGTKMNRVTTIHFPFIADLINNDGTLYGVNVPKKHTKVAIKLFELLIPNGSDHNEYSVGSNSRVAPYFTSFILSYHKVMKQINNLINTYGKYFKNKIHPIMLFDETLVDSFAEIHADIPPQKGNIGGIEEEELSPWEEETQTTNKQTKVAKVKPTGESGVISPDEFFSNMKQPMLQPQMQMQQPQMQMQQTGAWNNMQMQPQMQMQQMNPFMQTIQPQMQMNNQNNWNPMLTAQAMQMQQPQMQMGYNNNLSVL